MRGNQTAPLSGVPLREESPLSNPMAQISSVIYPQWYWGSTGITSDIRIRIHLSGWPFKLQTMAGCWVESNKQWCPGMGSYQLVRQLLTF